MFGYSWLKPSYIVIALLTALVAVQTFRLQNSEVDLAKAQAVQAQLVADIATQRTEGVKEGQRLLQLARDSMDSAHLTIVNALAADKADVQKRYDQTYGVLKTLAAKEQWRCLSEPLPEDVLNEFRR